MIYNLVRMQEEAISFLINLSFNYDDIVQRRIIDTTKFV
jgi:hypothetical protein